MGSWRRQCALALALGTALANGAIVRAEAVAPRPHLLLLVAEDLSLRIGAFGDPVARTPNLDRLANEGVRYPNTFTTAGVCAPSRAALITGMHQVALGAQHMRASSRPAGGYRSVPPAHVKAFPELLRAAGYYTFVTEKLDYQFSGPGTGTGPFTIWDAEDDDTLWRGRDPDQPFFGMLNFLETHETGVFAPLGSWPHGILHFGIQLWRAWRFGLPGGDDPTPPERVAVPPIYPDTPIVRADIARHYDNVHQMDAAVGAVLARLAADGLADSTIVVWTTDHGDGLPRAKRELFDTGIRVPMIVRWPEAWRPSGVVPGSVDERLISFVDLAPTLLELAGVTPPDHLHGRSFASPDAAPRAFVYAARDRIDEVVDRQRAVRDVRFEYIRSGYPGLPGGHRLAFRDNLDMVRELRRLHEAGALDPAQEIWFEPPGVERLFDTVDDPDEVRNLAADPGYAAVLERMRAALDAWLERIGDTREVPEDEMVARFRPRGEAETTPPPTIALVGRRVTLRSQTPGASLGYLIDAGRWRLYTGPFDAPPGSSVYAKAVRYGWKESEVARTDVPSQQVRAPADHTRAIPHRPSTARPRVGTLVPAGARHPLPRAASCARPSPTERARCAVVAGDRLRRARPAVERRTMIEHPERVTSPSGPTATGRTISRTRARRPVPWRGPERPTPTRSPRKWRRTSPSSSWDRIAAAPAPCVGPSTATPPSARAARCRRRRGSSSSPSGSSTS